MDENEVMKSKGKEVKYIAVELMERNSSNSLNDIVEGGLFKGIEVEMVDNKTAKSNVMVYDPKEKSTQLFSLDCYSVVTFEVCSGNRELYFFRVCDTDQQLALNEMLTAVHMMQAAERMTGNQDIIDVDKYTDLPEKLTGEHKTNTASSYTPGSSINKPNIVKTYNRSSATNYTSKVDDATSFARKNKVTYDTLKKMKTKINQIREGAYTAPQFPDFGPDDDTEDDSTTITNTRNILDTVGDDEWDNHWMTSGYAD